MRNLCLVEDWILLFRLKMLITQIIYYLLNYYLGILICVRFPVMTKNSYVVGSGICAITCFQDSGKINENTLSKKEHLALKNLIKNRDFIIQKADKGNTVVILNKSDSIYKINVVLNDSSKFQKLSVDQSKVLNHIVHMENRIIDVFKKVRNKKVISEKKYEDLHPVGSYPGILYGRAKIDKLVLTVSP